MKKFLIFQAGSTLLVSFIVQPALASEVFYEGLPLEAVLESTKLVVVAKPAVPPRDTQKLKLERSGDTITVRHPNGAKVTELEKHREANWSKVDFVPSFSRYNYTVSDVLHGELPKGKKTICVLYATWSYDVWAGLAYEYNGMMESPIHEAYESKTQRGVKGNVPRILFLVPDSIDKGCYREAVSNAYESMSELGTVKRALKGR